MARISVEPPVTEYLHAKSALRRIPISGTFELTPLCNMSCRMCYVRITKEEQEAVRPLRTAKEWISLAEEAKKQGLLYLLLTGGEPFMRPDFKEILSALHHMGFIISINSNGTLIRESDIRWLRETPPARINMTLYGASDETYGRLCGNPKGFTQAARAIRLLKEAGISIKLNCSVTPYNVGDLEKIFAFAGKENLMIQATSYMFPPMRKDKTMVGRNDRFTPEEAAFRAAQIELLLNGKERFLERMGREEPPVLPADQGEDCREGKGEEIRCRAGKCSFWVTWDGNLLPCGMLPPEEKNNVFEIGFAKAWKRASDRASEIRLPSGCRSCNLKDQCRACAAMVYTESGNFREIPEYRCKMAHAYPAACKRMVKELEEE